jgi:hypothetical protein
MEEDDYGAVDRGNRAAQLEGMNYGGKVTKNVYGRQMPWHGCCDSRRKLQGLGDSHGQ